MKGLRKLSRSSEYQTRHTHQDKSITGTMREFTVRAVLNPIPAIPSQLSTEWCFASMVLPSLLTIVHNVGGNQECDGFPSQMICLEQIHHDVMTTPNETPIISTTV